MSAEYLIPQKHTLKILCKSEHFPRKYKGKREWVFFSEHSVYSEFSEQYKILLKIYMNRCSFQTQIRAEQTSEDQLTLQRHALCT